mmetsp:Transcript_15031/g.42627  ORF Transcript_15031/g.42627 Transcript_15031/m.42627 type:complete len:465 (+) Transcript_15031:120-1514(+)
MLHSTSRSTGGSELFRDDGRELGRPHKDDRRKVVHECVQERDKGAICIRRGPVFQVREGKQRNSRTLLGVARDDAVEILKIGARSLLHECIKGARPSQGNHVCSRPEEPRLSGQLRNLRLLRLEVAVLVDDVEDTQLTRALKAQNVRKLQHERECAAHREVSADDVDVHFGVGRSLELLLVATLGVAHAAKVASEEHIAAEDVHNVTQDVAKLLLVLKHGDLVQVNRVRAHHAVRAQAQGVTALAAGGGVLGDLVKDRGELERHAVGSHAPNACHEDDLLERLAQRRRECDLWDRLDVELLDEARPVGPHGANFFAGRLDVAHEPVPDAVEAAFFERVAKVHDAHVEAAGAQQQEHAGAPVLGVLGIQAQEVFANLMVHDALRNVAPGFGGRFVANVDEEEQEEGHGNDAVPHIQEEQRKHAEGKPSPGLLARVHTKVGPKVWCAAQVQQQAGEVDGCVRKQEE